MKINHAALRVIRERSGFSQSRIAELAAIDRPNYVHIEAGRRPGTAEQIRSIAAALDVPFTALLGPENKTTEAA